MESRIASVRDNKQVGETLRAYRRCLEWNQKQMAESIGRELGITLDKTSISKWELGQRAVPAVVLRACERLARARGPCDPSDQSE